MRSRRSAAAFPDWEEVAEAPTAAVADAIRSGGLADTKAPRIQAVLEEVRLREGRFDLSRLRTMPDDEVRSYLTSLPGIGPKTAAVVLSFALGRDAIPVDTHVHRVATGSAWCRRRSAPRRPTGCCTIWCRTACARRCTSR